MKLRMSSALLTACWALCAADAPTQPTISKSCVKVTDIYSRPDPARLEASFTSNCKKVAGVYVTIAYFDNNGDQIGARLDGADVAPGARYRFVHEVNPKNEMVVKLMKIIKVDVF